MGAGDSTGRNPPKLANLTQKNIYNINPNFADFIVLKSLLNPNGSTYLIDTQADISVIKASSICRNFNWKQNINTYDIINIKGITHDSIRSFGTISINFRINNGTLPCTFHVVPDNFNIPSDGILGKDFLKNYKCHIDYYNMNLIINTFNDTISIPILEAPGNKLILPPRCEVIRSFSLTNEEPCLIIDQEIYPGVFIPKTIVASKNPLIRVMNTTNHIQSIPKNTTLRSEPLSNYSVYKIIEVPAKADRVEKLMKQISKNLGLGGDKLKELCKTYSDIFYVEGDKMTTNNFYQQKLRIKDDSPVYVKNYRLPHSQKNEIREQVNKLLEQDLIEPSQSEYNSPVILVPKKGNSSKWRMCIDFRLVNKKLIADKYPLPRMEEILDRLGRAKLFSVLDLHSGFHQVPLHSDSRDITSFSTEEGFFRWKVLPFGLNVSPNSFSRMMAIAFSGAPPLTCFLYMDDIIVMGCSEMHHFKNLKEVFEICRRFNLKLNPEKCQFFRSEVTYLGHTCSDKGIMPDGSKTEVVGNYPQPQNKDETRRFVAFMNYYRRFIPNFAKLAKPLNALSRKKVSFIWTAECEESFQKLKNSLINPPILKYPDFCRQFTLIVDASQFAVGATLTQEYGGMDLPVSFASRSLTKGEINKSTIEKELAAIHFAVQHYRPYIYGTHFKIKTDHRPLTYLFSLRNPSSKLTRMRLDLEEYNYTIEYIKGTSNVVADALSRITSNELRAINKNVATIAKVETRAMTRKKMNDINNSTQENNKQNEQLRTKMKENNIDVKAYDDKNDFKLPRLIFKVDKMELKVFLKRKCLIKIDKNYMLDKLASNYNDLRAVTKEMVLELFLKSLEKEADSQKMRKVQLFNDDEIFKMFSKNELKNKCNEVLQKTKIAIVKRPKNVATKEDQLDLLRTYHNNPIFGGHTGQRRLYSKLRSEYFWKNMAKDVSKFVRNCDHCNKNKPSNRTIEPMILTETPQKPFDTLIIDTIGPFKESENHNKYAVTLICNLTKYLVTVPIPNKEARTIANAIVDNCFLIYGPMTNILSDRGTEYVNKIMQEVCQLLQIKHTTSTAYHHETLGSIERNHRVLNEYLRTYVNKTHDNWDLYLKYFTYCYNTTPHTAFQFKYCPFELVFGKTPRGHEFLNNNRIEPVYNYDNYATEVKFKLQTSNELAKRFLELAKIESKNYYDRKVNKIDLKINDEVLITNENREKLDPLYKGPYTVKSLDGANAVLIDMHKKTEIKIHKNRLIKYRK